MSWYFSRVRLSKSWEDILLKHTCIWSVSCLSTRCLPSCSLVAMGDAPARENVAFSRAVIAGDCRNGESVIVKDLLATGEDIVANARAGVGDASGGGGDCAALVVFRLGVQLADKSSPLALAACFAKSRAYVRSRKIGLDAGDSLAQLGTASLGTSVCTDEVSSVLQLLWPLSDVARGGSASNALAWTVGTTVELLASCVFDEDSALHDF